MWDRATSVFLCKRLRLKNEHDKTSGILGHRDGNRVFLLTAPKNCRALVDPLPPGASVWVSWPKKSSKVPTTITEDTIRELALPLGLVDDTWSGLKLAVRKALR